MTKTPMYIVRTLHKLELKRVMCDKVSPATVTINGMRHSRC
jgi:hypothetical protein